MHNKKKYIKCANNYTVLQPGTIDVKWLTPLLNSRLYYRAFQRSGVSVIQTFGLFLVREKFLTFIYKINKL